MRGFFERHLVEMLLDVSDPASAEAIRIQAVISELPFLSTWEAYETYEHEVAERANRSIGIDGVASVYASMRELWNDVALQEHGSSNKLLWDSYLNGTRVSLEKVAAEVAGAEGAILTNSGMSALDSILGSAAPINTVGYSQRAYFETELYLKVQSEVMGFALLPFDPSNSESIELILSKKPDILIIEPVDNSYPVIPLDLSLISRAVKAQDFSKMLVIVDTSLFSGMVAFKDLASFFPNLVVVESASKFLTTRVGAGVIYAAEPHLSLIRERARSTGVALQQAALRLMMPAEIKSARDRSEAQSENAKRFLEAVDDEHWKVITRPSFSREGIITSASVIFLQPLVGKELDLPALTDSWVRRAMGEGLALRIRAGFGWPTTTARSYAADNLNRIEGHTYMRISIGLESAEELTRLASLLNAAAADS